MLYHAETLKQLRAAVDGLIKVLGEDAPVGRGCARPAGTDGDWMTEGVTLEYVVVDPATGRVAGTEAEDYELRMKPGEVKAARID